LLEATLETHDPMPWSPAAWAALLQELTAEVTTSPWLVVLLLLLLVELLLVLTLSSAVSSAVELDEEESTLSTVWCWWLDVGLLVSATAPPAPAVTASTANPVAARVETRLMSLLRSKMRYLLAAGSGGVASARPLHGSERHDGHQLTACPETGQWRRHHRL
jgi:hypothetical protein